MVCLVEGFARQALRHPDAAALVVGGDVYTYGALAHRAMSIAEAILEIETEPHPLGAVFARGSLTVYAGMLGVLFAGKGFVPLPVSLPIDLVQEMLAMSGARVLIVGPEGLADLDALLRCSAQAMTVIAPEVGDLSAYAGRHPRHRLVSRGGLLSKDLDIVLPERREEDPAYVVFESVHEERPWLRVITEEQARDRGDQTLAHTLAQTLGLEWGGPAPFTTWEMGGCFVPIEHQGERLGERL